MTEKSKSSNSIKEIEYSNDESSFIPIEISNENIENEEISNNSKQFQSFSEGSFKKTNSLFQNLYDDNKKDDGENLSINKLIQNKRNNCTDLQNDLYNKNIEINSLRSRVEQYNEKINILNNEKAKTENYINQKIIENKENNNRLNEKMREYETLIHENQNLKILTKNLEEKLNHSENEKKQKDSLINFQNESIKGIRQINQDLLKEISEQNTKINKLQIFQQNYQIFQSGIEHILSLKGVDDNKLKECLNNNTLTSLINLLIENKTNLKKENEIIEKQKLEINSLKKNLEQINFDKNLLNSENESFRKINENFKYENFKLQEIIENIQYDLNERKKKESLIEDIIKKHQTTKINLEKKDKFLAEILLLTFFYDKIRLLYKEKIYNIEDKSILDSLNFEEIKNFITYSNLREDIDKISIESNNDFSDLTNKILELFPKTKYLKDNSTQNSIVINENYCQSESLPEKKDFYSQIENEDNLKGLEEIQRKNNELKNELEKKNIFFEEKIKINKKLFALVENIFGWRIYISGKIIKLLHLKTNNELFFQVESDHSLKLLNKDIILNQLKENELNNSEIISRLTLMYE